jgi:hypothetical protein
VRSWAVIIILLILAIGVEAVSKQLEGKITYIAAGTVYISIGSEQGVKDSSVVCIINKGDTVAVLKVFAVSSKSSALSIVKSKKELRVGDLVVIMLPAKQESQKNIADAHKDSSVSGNSNAPVVVASTPAAKSEPGVLRLQGRISTQYYTTMYATSSNNFSQPSLVVNVRGAFRDVPVKFEVYGNYRTSSYGTSSLFSANSVNQSRIYRLSLQYDDGENALTLGRLVPLYAPSVGYVDGLMFSKKIDHLILGSTAGYQSRSSLNGITTAYKKFAFFGNFQTTGSVNMSTSVAYSRNYFHSAIDREVVSGLLSLYSAGGLGIYVSSEVDLRRKQDTRFTLSPGLTNLYANISYPIVQFLSLSVGGDFSRPYSDYSLIQSIPDSLLDRGERKGLNFGLNIFTARGVSFTNTYSPRSSSSGFGNEYANTTSLLFTNLLSTGVMVRTNFMMNANEFTSSTGYGANADKTIMDAVQFSFFFQHLRYTIKSLGTRNTTASLGGNILWTISREFSFIVDYNRQDGFGTIANSIFTELSYRF